MSNRKRKFELSPRLRMGVGRVGHRNSALKFGALVCLILATSLAVYGGTLVFKNHDAIIQNAAPQVLGASDTKTQEVQFIEYKVQKGDTLFNVSQKFDISWTTLSTLNNLKSPFTLKPGQILKIPR